MRTTTVVIGAGHAGLAMSRQLTVRSVDHVVLDRGGVADSWRSRPWPGLRLLTPSWMVRLPGLSGEGPDPDGYLAAEELADRLDDYASAIAAPVHAPTVVTSVQRRGDGFEVRTDDGTWHAASVVLATGANAVPLVPPMAAALPPSVGQITAADYRGPAAVAPGGVLVVGASSTGVQIAAELQQAGHQVTIAVGDHVRLPRTYRGRDIFWWLDRTGVLAEGPDQVDDPERARRLPSPQLVGSVAPVDIASLAARGVRVVGRLVAVDGGTARFSGSLRNVCLLADLKMSRLLDRADAWAGTSRVDGSLPPPSRPERTPLPARPCLALDLVREEISTVVWATGFRPDHSWLHLPVFDRAGRIQHTGGVVTDAPGLYALGLPLLRTRASTYIYGAAADTEALADRLVADLPRPIEPATRFTPVPKHLASRSPVPRDGQPASHRTR